MLKQLKEKISLKTRKMMLFGYALLIGTSVPVILGRCGANCGSCGSCGLFLGIIPIAAVLALKIRLEWILKPFKLIYNISKR